MHTIPANTHCNKATAVGQVGLCLWALVAALMALVTRLPTIEILLIIFTTSFVFSCIFLTIKKRWHLPASQPLALWFFNLVGICGADTLFVLASKNAPQADVTLINYLWPSLIILLAPLLPSERFQLKYLISIVLAFTGITLLLTKGKGLYALDIHYIKGYIYAFSGAMAWATYTLSARHYTKQIPEAIGLYCGIGALGILVTHPHLEGFIMPTLAEAALLVYMGITSHNLAYMCWNHGASKGNFKLLSLLAYLSPFICTGTLVMIGAAEPSKTLWTSATLVCAAGLTSAIDWKPLIEKGRLWRRKKA
jgi:drug/metabolite transporter (DMT)-like permease